MKYPSEEQIQEADITTLCRWARFLPSPGLGAVGQQNFEHVLVGEAVKMDRIIARQKEMGGMTPEISKQIGWNG